MAICYQETIETGKCFNHHSYTAEEQRSLEKFQKGQHLTTDPEFKESLAKRRLKTGRHTMRNPFLKGNNAELLVSGTSVRPSRMNDENMRLEFYSLKYYSLHSLRKGEWVG